MKANRTHFVLYIIFCIYVGTTQSFSQTSFVPNPNNPVVSYGPAGSWDFGVIYSPDIIEKDNLFYMFYSGSSNLQTNPFSIGFATSEDGISWTKYENNPIFQASGSSYDAFMVAESKVLVEDNSWIMYYNARSTPGPGPGQAIGRATALNPAGPWTRDSLPVLKAGTTNEWDAGFVTPNSIIKIDTGYVMYYSGGTGFPFPPNDHAMVGMATSPDGINWTKYNDPNTTEAPFAESDPVLNLGSPGSYDSGLAWECDVLKTTDGWEMFYTGDPDNWTGERICYATSSDGIHWEKYSLNNPILETTQGWATLDLVSPSVIKINSNYYLYYVGNTTLFNGQIGLATDVTTGIEVNKSSIPEEFKLKQNYPNPFNPSTTIEFTIQTIHNTPFAKVGNTKGVFATLKVYDILGKEIAVLVNDVKQPGNYKVVFDAADINSGIYFYQLKIGASTSSASNSFVQTKKMLLLK